MIVITSFYASYMLQTILNAFLLARTTRSPAFKFIRFKTAGFGDPEHLA